MKRCLLALLALCLVGCPARKSASQIEASRRREAPPIRLFDSAGVERTLEEFRGRVVVLNFWAPWCFSCKEELNALSEVREYFADSNFEVVAVTVLEDGQPAPATKYNFPVLLDSEKRAAKAYAVSMLPVTMIADKQGRIAEFPDPANGQRAERFFGPRGWNALGTVRALEGLIAE